jgi:hypothetical protein
MQKSTTRLLDPADGPPTVDDEIEQNPDPYGRCASCHDPIPVLGAAVCGCCQRRGFCVVCGLLHGGAQMCPAVAAVWAEQEAIEKAERSERVQEAAIHNQMVASSSEQVRAARKRVAETARARIATIPF